MDLYRGPKLQLEERYDSEDSGTGRAEPLNRQTAGHITILPYGSE